VTTLHARLYDAALAATEAGGLRAWRSELLAPIQGEVIEIGPGTGANLPLYPSDGPTQLTLCEPSGSMRVQLTVRLSELALPFPTRLRADPAGALADPDGSYDAAVCTLVLCTVPDPAAVLAELWRVLRPGGRLYFIEHVAASSGFWRVGQRLIEPVWRPLAGGCRLTRQALPAIEAAGFTLESVESAPLPRAPGFVRPSVRGVAIRGEG
jgi:SAM-dependent methyltransferase